MKHLKRFNESQEIKGKDLQETIDEILDKLSEKGKLSESEKKFMKAASNDNVKSVTVPNPSGNFWADMANPHNTGILWQDEKGVWSRLMSLEEEELEEIDDEDEKYYRRRELDIERALNENPGLKEDLEELLKLELKVAEKSQEINKKYRKNIHDESNYNFNQKLDYATNQTLQSLINQFGYEDDDGNMFIGNEK